MYQRLRLCFSLAWIQQKSDLQVNGCLLLGLIMTSEKLKRTCNFMLSMLKKWLACIHYVVAWHHRHDDRIFFVEALKPGHITQNHLVGNFQLHRTL